MFRSGLGRESRGPASLVLAVGQQQHLPRPPELLHETFLPPVVDPPVLLPHHGGAADKTVHPGGLLALLSPEILRDSARRRCISC